MLCRAGFFSQTESGSTKMVARRFLINFNGYFPLLMDTVEVARGIKLSRHLFVHLSVILTLFHNQRDRDSSSLAQLFSLIHQ